ncbi:hypothetical protein ABT072_27220 [Streptomyces sp. NPDC002589]
MLTEEHSKTSPALRRPPYGANCLMPDLVHPFTPAGSLDMDST